VVPIVFVTGADPVRDGLVASLNRPGGNVTGVSFLVIEIGAKRLDLLRQLVPNAGTIAMLVNPRTPDTESERREVQAAAQAMGQRLIIFDVKSDRDIDAAFATATQRGAGALLAGAGAFTNNHRKRLIAMAARHAIPAMYSLREFVTDGGLISYAASITDAYRQAGIYSGRILKGEKPADLPVMQSTRLELVINLKTARTLGLTIPDKLLALADEVIE
jgi:putative ABC transport system substrate-binding protein